MENDVGVSQATEMEVRVARALYADQFPHLHLGDLDNAPHFFSTMVRRARIAIRAMREPTTKMVTAALNSNNGDGPRPVRAVDEWQAMIDAATAPPQEATAPQQAERGSLQTPPGVP